MEDNYEEEMHYHFVIQNAVDAAGRYGIDKVIQDIVDTWNCKLKQTDSQVEFPFNYMVDAEARN
jgi:hypothetical protein